ncbi:MAG: protease inhibitor I42 family protein, partial [Bacteroidota bacterium]
MHKQVGPESNNTTLTAHPGDTIGIQLNETLTAGYEWAVDSIAEDCCQLQSSDYIVNQDAAIGGSGLRKMVFLVTKKGDGNIKLKNYQRWSGDIDKTF